MLVMIVAVICCSKVIVLGISDYIFITLRMNFIISCADKSEKFDSAGFWALPCDSQRISP